MALTMSIISPIPLSVKESYAVLNKYEQSVAKEEAEKVDTLRYTWEKLLGRSTQVQNQLVSLQPNFRGELISNVETFVEDCHHFYQDYDKVQADTDLPACAHIEMLHTHKHTNTRTHTYTLIDLSWTLT